MTQTLKDFYISGETVSLSLPARTHDVRAYVVFSKEKERKEGELVLSHGVFALSYETGELSLGDWKLSLWRESVSPKGETLKEVVSRSKIKIISEDTETVNHLEQARENVAMLKDGLRGVFGNGVKKNKIRDREVERFSPSELLELLSYWEKELYRLEVASGVRKRKNIQFYC